MGETFVIVLYVACEITANITANKPIEVLGVVAPGGVFIYALTFTLLDLIHERLGRGGARKVVFAAFAANLLFAFYASFVVALPAPSFFAGQAAFALVLGSAPRIVAASLVAYLASSLIDVEVFALWKRHVRGPKWLRVLSSNAVSTGVDSALFVVLAFGGILPVLPLIAGQYFLKMMVTVVSLPLMYAVRSADVGR